MNMENPPLTISAACAYTLAQKAERTYLTYTEGIFKRIKESAEQGFFDIDFPAPYFSQAERFKEELRNLGYKIIKEWGDNKNRFLSISWKFEERE